MTPATPPDPAGPRPLAASAAARRRRGRLLACWAGALLLLPLLALAALLLAAQSEAGSRLLWRLATQATAGRLSAAYAGGTLARGMQLRDLRYHDGTLQLSLDRFAGRWRLDYSPLRLNLDSLRLGQVELQLVPAGSAPARLPQDLQLPLAFKLGVLSIEKLTLRRAAMRVEVDHLLLHAASDRVRHQLQLETVDTPYGKASARLQLDGRAPFALSGGAELGGSYRGERYRLDAQLAGTLAALALRLDAGGDKLNGQAQVELAPFAAQPLGRAQISAVHLNPKLFNPGAPSADLALHADLAPESAAASGAGPLTLSGTVSLQNASPGSLDQDRLPLVAASLRARLTASSQQLAEIRVDLLRGATLRGAGQLQRTAEGASGAFQLEAQALDLHALHARLQPTRLHGPLTLRLQPQAQQVSLDLADARYRLQLQADIDSGRIQLRRAQLDAGRAQLRLAGTLARDAAMGFALSGTLADFDPALWLASAGATKPAGAAKFASRVPSARINLGFAANGALAPQWQLRLKFDVHDSSYDRLPLTGGGTLNLADRRLLPSALQLAVAGNRLSLNGSFGAAGDRLQLHLDAPELQRLGYGLDGVLQIEGELGGSLRQPTLHATYRAEKLAFGVYRLAGLSGRAELQGAPGGTRDQSPQLALSLDAHGYRGPQATLEKLHAQLSGSARRHSFSAEAEGRLRGQPLALAVAAQGGLSQEPNGRRWDGTIDRLESHGQPRLVLNAPLPLSVGANRLLLGAARLTLADAVLDLKNFAWEQGRIRSQGAVSALALANLLQLQHQFTGAELPLKTDLVLDGSWNLAVGDSASGFVQMARRSGDIRIDGSRGGGALGLSVLQLRADLQAGGIQLDLQAVASRAGSLAARARAGWQRQDGRLLLTPEAPLAGHVSLRLPQLKALAALAGPQLALDGSLDLDLDLAGSLGQPKWTGTIAGDHLALTLFDPGIQLHDGTVRIGLQQNQVELRQIEFHGGEGSLRASGRLQLDESNPALAATIVADRLQLFASPDRRLTLSGQARIARLEQQLHIDGKVTVDRALFDLPKKSAPQLGDDVVVVRRGQGGNAGGNGPARQLNGGGTRQPAGRWSPVVDIAVDLGRDFRFRGNGAELLLRGDMAVHSEPYAPLRATGTVRVAEGSYEAFGRKLAIERGLLNFQGPIDNPNISILAMRRNQEVEAGVEVSGLAQQPRVRLVSEPNVGDEEKLSWLMFGHGSDSNGLGQQQAAGAALALLGNASGKRLAQGIGLDQFSIGASESGLADQQVVNLGKAISERFYVGYEQSLTGAASIVRITYQLSRRWSLVARGGAISGLDVLFSKRFD